MEFQNTAIESELEKYGVYASNTKGVSMEPLFRTNRDMVVISRPTGELRKYDVALYRSPGGKYVLHRVVGVKDDLYLIRGDNTYTLERVPKQAVIGVLTEFNRKGRARKCTDLSYRIYSVVWTSIYPLRGFLRYIRYVLRAICRKLFKKRH